MDLSKLSDADLEAIAAGDMKRVSDAGLRTVTGDKESADFTKGRKDPIRGLYAGLQGPSFGFSDEVLGFLGAAGKTLVNNASFGDNYREMRDYYRGAAKQAEQDSVDVLGKVGGGAFNAATQLAASAPTLPFLKGPAVAGMLPNALQAGKVGAITGALGGAGNSTAETPLGLAADTAIGGGTGFALGAGSVLVARGMGGMYDVARANFSGSAAEQMARQKVAEALLRDGRGAVAANNAPAVTGQVEARLMKLGPEARLIDASGQNTRQLGDTLSMLPGQTKQAAEAAILSRQAGRADRLRGAAASSLGKADERLLPTIDDLVAKRSEQAAPLYDALYKKGVFINDELRGIIDAANKLGAGGEAKRIATAKQMDYGLTPETQWAGMRELDYLKQGLDDIIAANKNEFGKLTKVGAAVQGLKNDLVSLLDQETRGLYKEARNAFAGPSALIDAAKEGRMVWSRDDTMIDKTLKAMTDGERDAFRTGAFEALRSKLGNMSGQNEIMRMWRDKTTQEKLKAIFGTERAFREFASTVAAESRMKGLESVGRGSQTAARQYGAGDLDAPAVVDAVRAVSNPMSLTNIADSAARAWNRVSLPEPVRDRMGSMLLSQGDRGMINLRAIEQELNRVANERAMKSGLLGIGSGEIAAPLGGLLMGR